MHLIEPCCAPKQLRALRGKIANGGTCFWHGYGDLSLTELLPHILTRYSEVEMLIATPALPRAAAVVIKQMMERTWMSMDGKSRIDNIGHLTLISDFGQKSAPTAYEWVKDNPFGERLTLKNVQQGDTAIILPDIAFFGNINLVYRGHFTALATTNTKIIDKVRQTLLSLTT